MKLNKISLGASLMLAVSAFSIAFPAAAQTVSLEEASNIYRENCAVCHGDRGDGQTRARSGLNPPPRDFTTPEAAAALDRQKMINTVVAGKPGTAMVAWHGRLTKPEIDAVVDYVRTTFMALAPDEEDIKSSEPELAKGKELYEEHCRVCHGDRGNGSTWTKTVLDPSPRNFTAPQSRRILTRKRMLASVTFGRKGTAMMSFSNRLSEQEIGYVVDYVRSTFMKGDVVPDADMSDLSAARSGHGGGGHAGAQGHGTAGFNSAMAPRFKLGENGPVNVDMDAGFPGDLKGDFNNGRALYLRTCATCHGPRGDGLGPRSYFINPKPRNFLHPESRAQLNRPALFKAIVVGKPGTVMPAWGKVLGPQQVADVAEFVFMDFIHPDPDSLEGELDTLLDEIQLQPSTAVNSDKKKDQ